ncbi:PilZ domain-containing protein [Leptospira fluminis]|uniref:PilZ domain-containing protein n=2 Tax=Leptospira fluminis TaxID=2484979 RepID=A0A4R9GS86_9LEPT|nr:PilZ domain-containing protein [Leptospira fluminis]
MERLEIGKRTSPVDEPDCMRDKRFYIRFRRQNRVRVFYGGECIEGDLIDISMIGISLVSGGVWEIGSHLKIMSSMFSCQLEAEVIRKEEMPNGTRYALVFGELTDDFIIEILNKIPVPSE